MDKSVPLLLISSLQVFEGCSEISLDPSPFQEEQAQLPQPSWQEKSSNALNIFTALLWTCSNSPTSFLCWGSQAWTQYSRWSLMRAEQRAPELDAVLQVGSYESRVDGQNNISNCWSHFSWCSPGYSLCNPGYCCLIVITYTMRLPNRQINTST